MKKTRIFRFMAFMTYLPLPLLGIIIIFGLMGKFLGVGWLESAPGVLKDPMILAYFLSLIMGAIYGYMKSEDSVYFMAFIAIGVWILGFVLARFLTLPDGVMYVINMILIGAVLILHIMQYKATRKWDSRLT